MQATRAKLGSVMLICDALFAASVWVLLTNEGKNGFDLLPLPWYLALVLAPLLSIVCVVLMYRIQAGSRLWPLLGSLSLIPLLYYWIMMLGGILHYW
jgi:hypothetical protein